MERRPIRTWDLPVRLLHLLLAGGVAAAWLSSQDARDLRVHVVAGLLVGLVLVLRAAWGLWGTEHARWAAFRVPWRAVRDHARGLLRGDAPRFQGHNPLATWAMLGGLSLLALVVLTGIGVQAGEEGTGLLAGRLDRDRGVALHGPHELLAWAVLGWLLLHLAGVAKESLRTAENLPLSMVHGRKRPEPGARPVPARVGAALSMLALVALACAGPLRPDAEPAPAAVAPPALDPLYARECGDCHEAWHPSLLPARSWLLLMATQDDHFGEDLGLAPALAGQLQELLVLHAAELSPTEAAWRVARGTPPDQSPLRVTDTPAWREAHADLPEETFPSEPVRSRNRCEACHEDAATGAFAHRGIHPPDPGLPADPPPPEAP